MGRPLPLLIELSAARCRRCRRRPQRRQQGAGLRQPSVAFDPGQANGSTGPVLAFDGDSDAHIVRGLIAILFALYSGKARRTSCPPTPLPCSRSSDFAIT